MRDAEPRFVGLDLHRHDVMVGAVDAHQDIVLTPQRVTLRQFAQWASRHLRPTDVVLQPCVSQAGWRRGAQTTRPCVGGVNC
jgi:hypothetical protein